LPIAKIMLKIMLKIRKILNEGFKFFKENFGKTALLVPVIVNLFFFKR